MKKTLLFSLLILTQVACACSNANNRQLKSALQEDPKILTEVIKDNPELFVEAINKAVRAVNEIKYEKQLANEKKLLEDAIKNPLKPMVRKDELIQGQENAPIQLVEYSDLQCPYCSKGNDTVKQLMDKYPGKIQVIFKHLPLPIHPQAELAAQFYEAIRLQDHKKAIAFKNKIFKDQTLLKSGELSLVKISKELKVDIARLKKDLNSKVVLNRIEQDEKEAKEFGFRGTPGYVLNGVPVYGGALPAEYFQGIIDELQRQGKINL